MSIYIIASSYVIHTLYIVILSDTGSFRGNVYCYFVSRDSLICIAFAVCNITTQHKSPHFEVQLQLLPSDPFIDHKGSIAIMEELPSLRGPLHYYLTNYKLLHVTLLDTVYYMKYKPMLHEIMRWNDLLSSRLIKQTHTHVIVGFFSFFFSFFDSSGSFTTTSSTGSSTSSSWSSSSEREQDFFQVFTF